MISISLIFLDNQYKIELFYITEYCQLVLEKNNILIEMCSNLKKIL